VKYRFKSKPFKHQRRGLKRLWKQGSGALFWEPGTGKTKTALDFAAALYLKEGGLKVLVLCPINAMQVWPAQMEKHLGVHQSTLIPQGKVIEKADQIREEIEWYGDRSSPLRFIILNYEAAIKRDKDWAIMQALEEYDADLLILDESQKVKSATAKRSKATHRLGSRARHVCLLSGTPVSKNYLDLYSQLKVIDPKIWRDPVKGDAMSWTRFRYRYGMWGGRTGYELRGYQNVEDLQERYRPWISTARKRDCLDLPPVTDEIIPVVMNKSARSAYDSFAEDGMVVWKRHLIDAPIVLTKLLRLQEMTSGSIHDELSEVVDFQRDKLAVLFSLVDDLMEAQEKVIIFARFKWELNQIRDGLSRYGLVQIRGGITAKGRKEAVDSFRKQDATRILVIQIAAGEALDGLQHACSHAIYYSTDYSWDHYVQSRGRLDRAGQKTPVTFYHLHMVNTIDGLVFKALRQKKNLEKLVMDDPELLVVDR